MLVAEMTMEVWNLVDSSTKTKNDYFQKTQQNCYLHKEKHLQQKSISRQNHFFMFWVSIRTSVGFYSRDLLREISPTS